jgi:hypothetical protein
MIIERKPNIIRADIAGLLVAYKLQPEDRIGSTCDVIEYLALRMRERSDIDVFNIAVFVQRELDKFTFGGSSYPETIETLVAVAFAIRQGNAQFYQAISRVPVCFGKAVQKQRGEF